MANLSKRPENNNGAPGNYYIRLWLPNQKRSKSIPLGTHNKREAEQMLKRVQHFEYIRKAEQIAIKALYMDIMSDQWVVEGIEKDLGIDQSVSLKGASEKYIKEIKRKGSSKHTVLSYVQGIKSLNNALGHTTKVTEIGKGNLQTLMNYLRKSGLSDGSINTRLRVVRSFFNWLEENDYILKAPFKIKLLKLENTLPKFIEPKELQAIYDSTDDPRLVSIFKVYEGTGMRLAELMNSKLKNGFLRIVGKGRKERIVPLPKELQEDYNIAINSGMADYEISKGFTKARRKAGIDKNKTLHSLRHTYAVKLWVDKGDIKLVQAALGHSSVVVTEVYTKIPTDYLKQVFKQRLELSAISGDA
jgi:integrase/recombinase XerD